jgi:hypothetical protein
MGGARVRNLIILAIFAGLGWYGYGKYKAAQPTAAPLPPPIALATAGNPGEPEASLFKCDGRTRCPQMTSCAEATYFIQHCPNTTMDGDDDGVPCESQWCN